MFSRVGLVAFPCRRRSDVWFNVWADEAVLISPSHWRSWRFRRQARTLIYKTRIYKESANRADLAAPILAPGFRAGLTIAFRIESAAGWRRGRDSNPRYSLRPYDALAKRCLQPLGHLSGASLMHLIAWAGQFGSVVFARIFPAIFETKRPASLWPPLSRGWSREEWLCLPFESPSDSTIRVRQSRFRPRSSSTAPQMGKFDGRWNRLGKLNENKTLQARFDHICVLFVQHPSENALRWPVSERSLVVCAKAFGNCD